MEIDTDLRILKLQQEVDLESLKLNYHNAKQRLFPTHLLAGFGGILQKVIITIVARKLFRKII